MSEPAFNSTSRRARACSRTWICGGLVAGGLLLAVAAAWQPSGALSPFLVGVVPSVGRWLDAHGVLRNLPAFTALALPLLVAVGPGRNRLVAVLALALFAEVIEYPQLAMAGRHFDWRDIVCSHAGIAAAWLALALGGSPRRTARYAREFIFLIRRTYDRKPLLSHAPSRSI